jgi:hypothetical protein
MREMEYPSYPALSGPRLYWSAVLGGTVIDLALMMVSRALGVSLGIVAAPTATASTALPIGQGIGGPLFLWACGFAAFFCGGWVASRLSTSGRPSDGVIYGLVSWAAALVAVPFLYSALVGGLFGPVAFGKVGLGMMLTTGVAAALGGSFGARLYRPVPIEEYRTTRREREPVVSIR